MTKGFYTTPDFKSPPTYLYQVKPAETKKIHYILPGPYFSY